MPTVNDAYVTGARDALSAFNVRLAFDVAVNQVPEGAERHGATWLAQELDALDDPRDVVGRTRSYARLEKPSIWGPRASLESSTTNARNYSGIGAYGGV